MHTKAHAEALDLPLAERENYVPLHTTDLVEYLTQHPALPKDQQADFRRFSSLVLSLLHHLYRQHHEQLNYVYAALDPDCDRMLLAVPTSAYQQKLSDELFERAQVALSRANYHRLAPEDIRRAIQAASQWGVRMQVDFDNLRRLEVYARGCVIGQRETRSWRRWFRRHSVDVPLYQRLVVLFQVNEAFPSNKFDARKVYLRMFKNVPQADVDMMLPATGIHMTWIDHSKIVVPSLYAAGITLWRFLRNVVLLAFFGVFKTVGLALLVLFAIGFGIKSMFTYRTNTKRRYLLNMTQSLYYQNLDNNAGVLLRLLEEGEQQEACEAVLAYFATAWLMPADRLTLADIDLECESLLHAVTGVHVDFDVEDTVRILNQLGIMSVVDGGWRAVPVADAIRTLDKTWDNWFS